jgi:hypothetical protein
MQANGAVCIGTFSEKPGYWAEETGRCIEGQGDEALHQQSTHIINKETNQCGQSMT